LDNHLGVGDKTLAEFIIELGKDQTSAAAFQKALAENGAEMPLPLVRSLVPQ
jgi:ATP-dependent RNA helicase DHX8/PRP22